MSNQQHFKYSTGVVAYPIFFLMLIWVVFWLQVRFFPIIKTWGIVPETLIGLRGIVLSPLIHSNIEHIYHNSIPLVILTMALFYFYRPIAWKVLLYGILLSGLITWTIGRPSNHIGASGVIYVLVSFIFFKGIFAKHFRLVALSLMIIFLYGSMIWYVLPIKDGMSWEGHLGGFITGLLFAIIFRKAIAKPERYVWQEPQYNEEDDPFLRHFDENGNFIGNLEGEEGVAHLPDGKDIENEVEVENARLQDGQEIENQVDRGLDAQKTHSGEGTPKFNYIYKENTKD